MSEMSMVMMWHGIAMLPRLRRMHLTRLDPDEVRRRQDAKLEEAKESHLPLLAKAMRDMANQAGDQAQAAEIERGFWDSPDGERLLHSLKAACHYHEPHVPETVLFKAMLEAGDISLENPLHMMWNEKFLVPSYHAKKEISAGQVLTLIAFGMFVHLGENKEACEALLELAPIETALRLVEPSPWDNEPMTPGELGIEEPPAIVVPAQGALFD